MSELLLVGWGLLACATALLWASMSRRERLRRYLGTKRCSDASCGVCGRWEAGGPGARLNEAQPAPVASLGRPIWELVIADMQGRDATGRRKYGVPLQAHNGRDALVDAYQEALDLAVYLRQAIEERAA